MGVDSVNSYLFDGLLITEDGVPLSQSKGIAFLASGKFWVNNHAHVVKGLGGGRYGISKHRKLCEFTGSYRDYAAQAYTTSGRVEYSRTPPPIAEQRRIVAEIEKQFTRLDASVAALKRVQANLKRYRASVLKAACEGKLVPTEAELAQIRGPRLRARRPAPGAHPVRTPRPLGVPGEAPGQVQGACRAGHVRPAGATGGLGVGDGGAITRQKRIRNVSGALYEPDGLPVLRIPNIVAGELDLIDLKYATRPVPIDSETALAKGDVLMCRTNGSVSLVGKTAVVNKNWSRITVSPRISFGFV